MWFLYFYPHIFHFLGVDFHPLRNTVEIISIHNCHTFIDVHLNNLFSGRHHLGRTDAVVQKLAAVLIVLLLAHLIINRLVAVQNIRDINRLGDLVHSDLINTTNNHLPGNIFLDHHLQVGSQTVSEEHL